jgi:hypothetical protein
MEKKIDDYTSIRVWAKTLHRLKLLSVVTGKSIIETVDRLALEECERTSNGGVQVDAEQNAALMAINEVEFNRLMDKRLREDPEFRARYEETGKHVAEHERQNNKNVYSQQPSESPDE